MQNIEIVEKLKALNSMIEDFRDRMDMDAVDDEDVECKDGECKKEMPETVAIEMKGVK